MAIRIQFQPDASVVAAAAASAGRAQSRIQQAQLELEEERLAIQEDQFQRRLEATSEAQIRELNARKEAQLINNDFRQQAAGMAFERSRELIDERLQADLEKFQGQYTKKQQLDLDRIQEDIALIQQDPTFTPEEKQELIFKLKAKGFGIKASRRQKQEEVSLTDQLKKRVIQNPDGSWWVLQPNGQFDLKNPPKDTTSKNIFDARKENERNRATTFKALLDRGLDPIEAKRQANVLFPDPLEEREKREAAEDLTFGAAAGAVPDLAQQIPEQQVAEEEQTELQQRILRTQQGIESAFQNLGLNRVERTRMQEVSDVAALQSTEDIERINNGLKALEAEINIDAILFGTDTRLKQALIAASRLDPGNPKRTALLQVLRKVDIRRIRGKRFKEEQKEKEVQIFGEPTPGRLLGGEARFL